MKTTIELPDSLIRAIKLRAVRENRKLKDVMADLLRRGMAQPEGAVLEAGNRVRLPLVKTAHRALASEEMTPERVAQVLLDEEARNARAE